MALMVLVCRVFRGVLRRNHLIQVRLFLFVFSFHLTEFNFKAGPSDPRLAVSYNSNLFIIRLSPTAPATSSSFSNIEYKIEGGVKGKVLISSLHWINDQFLGYVTNQEELVIFDTLLMKAVECSDIGMKNILALDVFNGSRKERKVGISYLNCINVLKGRICVLVRMETYYFYFI
jgi:hypothetical protein